MDMNMDTEGFQSPATSDVEEKVVLVKNKDHDPLECDSPQATKDRRKPTTGASSSKKLSRSEVHKKPEFVSPGTSTMPPPTLTTMPPPTSTMMPSAIAF
jgi:hypothetical protein